MGSLFITGASGFIGRSLLGHLAKSESRATTTVLTRSPETLLSAVPPAREWCYLAGDITQPQTYATALSGVDTVVHLAATTGKANPDDYVRVIREGTRQLAEACHVAGVSRFILVSTVAAGFPDQRYYPYATAKAEAEQIISDSRMDWLIVRPTMVFGDGSPVLRGLATLAGAPVGLMPGPGGVMVQPVDRDDLAWMLCRLVGGGPSRETIDLGGPDKLTMLDLMRRIRSRLRGRPGPMLYLPLELMRRTLGVLEPGMRPLLPVTAGQLAAFANHSDARWHAWTDSIRTSLKSVDTMLTSLAR